MAHTYVRICPVCERENPPERTRCACGALLAGVDFSVKIEAPEPAASADVVDSAGAQSPVAPGTATTIAAAVPGASDVLSADASATGAAAPIVCPHPDCAQPNPPGHDRCVYCNRPLRAAPPASAIAGARPLPAALRDGYRVIDVFPATGGEADILLVADVKSGERCVAKLYRRGVAPDFKLLEILARSVGDTVVRVLGHGISDGAAYELLEYIPGGTLEDLLRAGPLPKSDLRRIVKEIADALNGIHAHRILHRDLKPENVLIRAKSPLELALTDFGIASLSVATQHFTSAARTTRYAAPEALTGVLDAKSDWWSLGMIVLEAASGRHPFDGLNEQVMNHHLATRPIDVRGVYDDELRLLCRGLLLRDPKRRWGGEEVARWLAGDSSLSVPDNAEGHATAVRPYRFGKTEATTGTELALALAKHWDAARKDVARGQVARWLEQELHDYNLVRVLRDIQDRKGVSDDARLLQFLVAVAPDLPPVWRGAPVSGNAVLAAARAATNDDDEAQGWLDSLYNDGVLATYAANGHGALANIDRRWRDAWTDFAALWESARSAEEAWRTQPRDVGGGEASSAVSFDDLAYVATGKLMAPPQRAINGPLLLALTESAYVDALRGEVAAGLAQVTGYCPWFDALWEKVQGDVVGVVVARHLLPQAQEDATLETRRRAATADARARMFAEARAALCDRLEDVLMLAPTGDEDLESDTVARLLEAFEGFQAECQNVLRLGSIDEHYDALRRAVEKLSTLAMAAQHALAQSEQVSGINAIFLAPQRLMIGAVIVVGALLVRVPAAIIVVLAVATLVVGYRWYTGFRATESALAKLRLFGLHGRTFLRSGPGAPADRAEPA